MKIDVGEVLKADAAIRAKIENGNDWQSFLHISAVEIAGRIRATTQSNPMSEAELCYYFRRRGFGNTVIIGYILNKYSRRSTRDYLWDRDDFGRFYPANVYWRN